MNKHKKEGSEAYPKPSQADKQFDNQTEFIDQQPNDFRDKSISDLPANDADRQSNDPKQDTKQGE